MARTFRGSAITIVRCQYVTRVVARGRNGANMPPAVAASQLRRFIVSPFLLACLLLCGCGGTPSVPVAPAAPRRPAPSPTPGKYSGPSYDDAIQTYKAELELLAAMKFAQATELAKLDEQAKTLHNDAAEMRAYLERLQGYLEVYRKTMEDPATDAQAREDAAKRVASFDADTAARRQAIAKTEALLDRLLAHRRTVQASAAPQEARVEKALRVKEEAEKHR